MIPKPALQKRLDRPAPPPHRADGRFPEHHWRNQAVLQRLAGALDAIAAPSFDAVCALVDGVLADTDWVDQWLDAMAASARRDPFYEPPLAPTNNGYAVGLNIFSHKLVRMSLSVLPIDALADKKVRNAGPSSIVFTGSVTLQKFLRGGGASLRIWHARAATDGFSLVGEHRCRPGAVRWIADGDVLRLDGRSESYVVEHAIVDIVSLQAEILVEQAPLLVEYDSGDLSAVAACSTDDGASRSQMLLSFLACAGRGADAPTVERFTHDRHFFVRWHALRELMEMDAARGTARLADMAEADPHPELRAAAADTLILLRTGQAGEVH